MITFYKLPVNARELEEDDDKIGRNTHSSNRRGGKFIITLRGSGSRSVGEMTVLGYLLVLVVLVISAVAWESEDADDDPVSFSWESHRSLRKVPGEEIHGPFETVPILDAVPLDDLTVPTNEERFQKVSLNEPSLQKLPLDKDPSVSHETLKEFLDRYAGKIKPDKVQKSWNRPTTPNRQQSTTGWVSLDPIPWSVSKISKWNPKPKPKPVVDPQQGLWGDNFEDTPFYVYRKRPQQYHTTQTDRHKTPLTITDRKGDDCDHRHDIVTDGRPPEFPGTTGRLQGYQDAPSRFYNFPEAQNYLEASSNNVPKASHSEETSGLRRFSTQQAHPETHPFAGNGDWVLLSTTKGYKQPKRDERALKVRPNALGTRRAVRLTVLPPAEDSKINMTTSHGGLLQVESTFETVEESKAKLQRRRQKKPPQKVRRKVKRKKGVATKRPIREEVGVGTIPRSQDSGAVVAAVGAGMIPATMAMLVPMAMNGRRRKRWSREWIDQ